nr:MAG TPA: hypothetical protein [Caudoviricetes sp.]DAQ44944.1 MAG TPA: hypothetical protein [Caudoviricetes sp.]
MNILKQSFNLISKIIVNLFFVLLTIILNPFSAIVLFISGIIVFSIFGLIPLILITVVLLIIFQIIDKSIDNS